MKYNNKKIAMVYLGHSLMNQYRANATVVDTVPPDLLHMVPDHWYRFPPMNPLWHSLLGVAMIFLGFISITGNCMVLYLMSSVKSLRSPTNLLVTSLAMGDLLMMTTNMPAMASKLHCSINHIQLLTTFCFSQLLCRIMGSWTIDV